MSDIRDEMSEIRYEDIIRYKIWELRCQRWDIKCQILGMRYQRWERYQWWKRYRRWDIRNEMSEMRFFLFGFPSLAALFWRSNSRRPFMEALYWPPFSDWPFQAYQFWLLFSGRSSLAANCFGPVFGNLLVFFFFFWFFDPGPPSNPIPHPIYNPFSWPTANSL